MKGRSVFFLGRGWQECMFFFEGGLILNMNSLFSEIIN